MHSVSVSLNCDARTKADILTEKSHANGQDLDCCAITIPKLTFSAEPRYSVSYSLI
jgi:hypothetical protein